MEYKIEYLPAYSKTDLTAMRIQKAASFLMLTGIGVFCALLWHNREYVLTGVQALETMAAQLQEGSGTLDAVTAFCRSALGGFRG